MSQNASYMADLVANAEKYVKDLFRDKLPEKYRFHNFTHSNEVRNVAVQLADLEKVSERNRFCLEIASLFHDVGNIYGREGHELKSSEIANKWMLENNVPNDDLLKIQSLILCTNIQIDPQNDLEKIIRDADLAHLGSKDFSKYSQSLKKETENLKEIKITDREWIKLNLKFLRSHKFFSRSAQVLFDKQKADNIIVLEKMIEDIKENTADKEIAGSQTTDPGKKKKKKKKAIERPEKGIDTMFRVTLRNHVQLSRLADNKANIMLSINAVVLSVVLTSLLPKLDTNEFLVWPTYILLSVCIISIVFATLSTIPQVTKGEADREQIIQKKVNLLFFGNFHGINLEDYTWGMNYMMNDREYLYNSLIKDLYFLGKVLHKKYKFLRITYTVFMIGIILATFSFVWALAKH